MEDAHALAYAHVVSYLEVRVIQLLEVAQLTYLCLLYREKLDDTEFANQDYRAEKLKV